MSYKYNGCKNLKSITLSENLNHLGQDAFYGCSNLTEIVCKAQNPPAIRYNIDKIGIDRPGGVFYGVDKQNCKLYVSVGCEETYRNAEEWKDFNIIEMGTGIESLTPNPSLTERGNGNYFNERRRTITSYVRFLLFLLMGFLLCVLRIELVTLKGCNNFY